MDGIFNIDKEKGQTSHAVVQAVRRLAKQQRVGHAGTLDPAAEGVLLVCLGKATKVVEYLMDSPKRYCAQVTLGVVTDSGDAEGQVLWRAPSVSVGRAEVEQAVQSFQGRIQQVPPMYSALKQQGQPLYRLARRGVEVPREAREVEIYRIDLLDWQSPVATIDLVCSRGTYVRALATDLGERLGTGAFLSHLVRLASGQFTLDDAVRLEQLGAAFAAGKAEDYLYPLDEALLGLPAVVLGEESERRVRNGQSVTLALDGRDRGAAAGDLCRAYSFEGEIVALLVFDAELGSWRPEKVLV